jgi:hypothetical protein
VTNSWNLQPVHSPPPLPAPPTVTQAELELLKQLKVKAREFDQLRKALVAKLQSGASVEPGRFSVSLEERSSQRITSAAVAQLWGEAYVDHLRQCVAPTTSHHVTISEQFPSEPL